METRKIQFPGEEIRANAARSGIVLAGGHSRRMGCCKATLLLEGQTLLTRQVEKLRALGIRDILISGCGIPPMPGVRIVPDELPERGPLGGIYSCLHAARYEQCLVMSVDAPLVPVLLLQQLLDAHEPGVTILRHGELREPLLGVYDRSTADAIYDLIAQGSAPVRRLQQRVHWSECEYTGLEEYLLNCNTPQEYQQAKALLQDAGAEANTIAL